jgi:protoporphyrinogen oxidase
MKIVIVGAGVTGLTLGYLLGKKGFEITIIEKEAAVGGLARSFRYNGWSIDIGPHRFHTDDSLVHDFINEVMGDNLIEIARSSKVFFCDMHFEWPLTLREVLRLPKKLMFNSCIDLLTRPSIRDDSYDSYVLNRYGKTLTNHFFREYNQKFLKTDLKDCHRDWAETGINRATIDKDVKSSSIFDLLLGVLSTKHVNTKFLYPKDGPIDGFCHILRQSIESRGGSIECGVALQKSSLAGRAVRSLVSSDGRVWDADFVFWTGNIYDLESLLGCDLSPLNYCSTVVCNLLVEGTPPVPSQWEYFGSSEIIFCRTSTNICFNPALAPEGYYGICAELVCYQNDFVWKHAETHLNTIVQNLIHTKIIRNFNSIVDVHFEHVENTYPVYKLDYQSSLKAYTGKIKDIGNLVACGRTGGFWYNNMDHSIRSAIDIAGMIEPSELAAGRDLPVHGVIRGNF